MNKIFLFLLFFQNSSCFLLRQLISTVGRINIVTDKLSTEKNNYLNKKVEYPKLNINDLSEQDKYDLQWYVIGTPGDFVANKPKKVTVWSKNYVVWKNIDGKYNCLDDVCSHKGASLSGGKIHNNCAVCPYHGYEFNSNGTLVKVPGLNFQSSPIYDVSKYSIVEKNGWVYLNTIQTNISEPEMAINIFEE